MSIHQREGALSGHQREKNIEHTSTRRSTERTSTRTNTSHGVHESNKPCACPHSRARSRPLLPAHEETPNSTQAWSASARASVALTSSNLLHTLRPPASASCPLPFLRPATAPADAVSSPSSTARTVTQHWGVSASAWAPPRKLRARRGGLRGVLKKYVASVSAAHTGATTY